MEAGRPLGMAFCLPLLLLCLVRLGHTPRQYGALPACSRPASSRCVWGSVGRYQPPLPRSSDKPLALRPAPNGMGLFLVSELCTAFTPASSFGGNSARLTLRPPPRREHARGLGPMSFSLVTCQSLCGTLLACFSLQGTPLQVRVLAAFAFYCCLA